MMRAYGRSKLCNILFTRELASRLEPDQVVATCLQGRKASPRAARSPRRGAPSARLWDRSAAHRAV
jgi:hypothetical protein